MAEPVLRIPVDDAAFKRYMEAFARYQEQLREQPDMWSDTNAAVLAGVAANLSLADAIGHAVSAAIRLGDAESRNSQRRRRDRQDEDNEQQRASGWRRQALDHVQELSRSSSTVVRSFSKFALGGGTGGLFGMVSDAGKSMGGEIGELTALVGHALNAGYEINNAVSERGLFARGIGATLGQQEGFHNNLGRYTNTDQGLDAVMNARGTPSEWWQFNSLGVDRTKGSNADVYGNVLRKQAELAKKFTDANGVTNWAQVDPRGGSAFGTTHEDLNRLKGLSGTDLDKAIKDAVSFKTPLQDRQIDAATKSAVAMDNNTTHLTDLAQAITTELDPALDRVTAGLNNMYNLFSFKWFGASSADGPGKQPSTAGSAANTALFGPLGPVADVFGFDPVKTVKDFFGGAKSQSSRKNDVRVYRDMAEYLKRTGLSDVAASGAAAGAIAESHGNPNAFNKQSGAFGIGQWLGPRKKGLFEMARRDHVDPSNYYEQLKYLAWELHGGDGGGSAVMSAQSIDAALKAYVYKFMRPQGKHNEHFQDAFNDVQRGTAVVRAANVSVKVDVHAPPGHQTAVTANSAARGG